MAFTVEEVEAILTLRDDMSAALASAQTSLSSFGAGAMRLGGALTGALTLPITAIGGASIKMAMDAVESENLFTIAFGGMATAARAWSEELSTNLGLNEFELRRTSATLNTMFLSMGLGAKGAFDMATGLTALSGDLASFFNLKPEDAFEKLRSGIVGQTEPLRSLGILVDENTTKTFAYTHGIAAEGAELTQVEKVLARYGTIMAQTSLAQGDLARTIDSPTNQLRIMKEQLGETATAFGMALLPAVTQVISALKRIMPYLEQAVQWFAGLSPAMQTTIIGVAGVLAALGPLIVILGSVATGFAALMPVIAPIGAVLAVLATGPIALVIAAIVALTAAWVLWGDDIQRIVADVSNAVKTWLVDFWEGSIFQAVFRLIQAFNDLFLAVLTRVAEAVGTFVGVVYDWLVTKFAPITEGVRTALGVVAGIWTTAKDLIIGIASALYTGVHDWLVAKFQAVVSGIKGALDTVTGFFQGLKDKVVGSSIVPDMMDLLAVQFNRLPSIMIPPTQAATGAVTASFMQSMTSIVAAVDQAFGTRLASAINTGVQWFKQGMAIVSDVGRLMAGDFTAIGDIIVKGWQLIQSAGKAIADFFRKAFGGPSAKELAGRELVDQFEKNLATMLSKQQLLEAGNEDWKKTVIAIRDAYIANGLSEQTALADAKRLWESSRAGGEDTQAVVDEITRKMGTFGTTTETTTGTAVGGFGDTTGAIVSTEYATDKLIERVDDAGTVIDRFATAAVKAFERVAAAIDELVFPGPLGEVALAPAVAAGLRVAAGPEIGAALPMVGGDTYQITIMLPTTVASVTEARAFGDAAADEFMARVKHDRRGFKTRLREQLS